MSREQRLAQLEELLAELREDTQYGGASSRASVGLPAAYDYGAGTQDRALAPRAWEAHPVTAPSPILDQQGRVIAYGYAPVQLPEQSGPKIDVWTQRLIAGSVFVGTVSVSGVFLLHAAAAAMVPLALIALIAVSAAYLKHSSRSGGGRGEANISINVKVNQRNG